MFGNLQEKLNEAFKKFKNKGKLTEKDVKEGLRSVKLALLEADVNFKVVKEFINRVTERAIGAEVLESLMPAQQVTKLSMKTHRPDGGRGFKDQYRFSAAHRDHDGRPAGRPVKPPTAQS